MKKTIALFICILTLVSITNATLNYNPRKNSYRFGGAYAINGEDYGFAVFNEAHFTIWKNISAGPNLYFARTGYYLDNKDAITHFYGVDLNIYYTIPVCKTWSIQAGPGYTFRHAENSNPYSFLDDSYYKDGRIERSSESGFIVNLNIEKGITERWSIGVKSTFQPFGNMNSLFYAGLYGGINF